MQINTLYDRIHNLLVAKLLDLDGYHDEDTAKAQARWIDRQVAKIAEKLIADIEIPTHVEDLYE